MLRLFIGMRFLSECVYLFFSLRRKRTMSEAWTHPVGESNLSKRLASARSIWQACGAVELDDLDRENFYLSITCDSL